MKIGVSLPVRELGNDLETIRAFAELAEELGFHHLRVPDLVLRPDGGHLHEPLTLMAWVAGFTRTIELVPSVLVLPSRQTALVAKQAAEIDRLSGGRLRLGIGVGASADEYRHMGADFATRGARCDEQMMLLKRLWTEPRVSFEGRFDTIVDAGLDPLPVQRPIPLWIGAKAAPAPSVVRRIGRLADGWFVLCTPEDYPAISGAIAAEAEAAGRSADALGTEAGVAVVGPREAEWQSRLARWRAIGLTHLCLRTLGGGLGGAAHLDKLREVAARIPAA
ncbi:MAG: TIGR03619 family F420-dependent LLM class oxidoreductase [Gammaproteobacteria bacterium]